jgi:hypothetical protein
MLASEALKVLSDRYGEAANGLLRFVFSPRAGWGYSRLPFFVVSNERAEKDQQKPLVKQENIQGNIHELSHFWWQIADANTPEDWINEGLAEYSSFTFVSDKFGLELRQHLIQQYLDLAANANVQTPFLQTCAYSPVRYLNIY